MTKGQRSNRETQDYTEIQLSNASCFFKNSKEFSGESRCYKDPNIFVLIKPIVKYCHTKIEFDPTTQGSENCLQEDDVSNKSLILKIRTTDANISFTHRLPREAFSSELLDALDIETTIVFAGAFECQADFVKAIIKGGADYCLILNRANKSLFEALQLFQSIPKSQILRYPNSSVSNSKRFGQIYYRILSGCLLPEPLQRKWSGLFYGAVIEGNFQKSRSSQSSRYFITSLPAKLNTIGKVNLYIENVLTGSSNLRKTVEIKVEQERRQKNESEFLPNLTAIDTLALSLLEDYRYRLWNKGGNGYDEYPSIETVMKKCRNPKFALECLAGAQGL